jgi:hypothetical protein
MCWKMVLEFNKAIVTRDMLSMCDFMMNMQCVEIKKVIAKAHNKIKQADYLFFPHSEYQAI